MGLTYATLEVTNAGDVVVARRQLMPAADVRRTEMRMLVDSGSYMLCLNEHLQAQLGLDIIDSMEGELADGSVVRLPVAGPVDLRFGNRQTSCRAVILPEKLRTSLGGNSHGRYGCPDPSADAGAYHQSR